MSRINEYFPKDISEKETPLERFHQALDESEASYEVFNFIGKHCANNWPQIFGSIENLEKVLKASKGKSTFKEKILPVIQFFAERSPFITLKEYLLTKDRDDAHPEFTFARAISTEIFPNDPLGFRNCFEGLRKKKVGEFLAEIAPHFYGCDFFSGSSIHPFD